MTSYTIAVYLFVHFQYPHSQRCIASPYLAGSSSLSLCAHSMAWVPLNQLDVHWTVDIIWMLVFAWARERVCVINTWNIHPKRLWWNQNNSSTIVTSGRIKFRYIRYISRGMEAKRRACVLGCAMCVHVCVSASFLFDATHMYSMLFLWYFTFIFVRI